MASDQSFGGDWTDAKLQVLRGYLSAYTMALRNTPFRKVYIDAFAGTGYRRPRPGIREPENQGELFPDLAAYPPQELLAGSARIALECEPPFDEYRFIERDEDRCSALADLAREFPDRESRVIIRPGDANEELLALCRGDWRGRRAVVFVDPFGMQVHWDTIAAIAGTRAMDLWLLFPLGIGVNRLLLRSAEIPAPWQDKLDAFLGTPQWREALYRRQPEQTSLFGSGDDVRIKTTVDEIGHFFLDRLRTVFPGVAAEPGVLRNSRNSPLYLFCFAASNARGAPIALRIATHLLQGLR
ncbi:MAG: three-Cys-motif partner protein TcmP [Myxococcota bacterium]|nr:three-Cys-motif partner protein TcmP [Myxococcota bacterium]